MDVVKKLVEQERTRRQPRDTGVACVVVRLFQGLCVTQGDRRFDVPEGCKRLLAFAALHEGPVLRRHAATTLWPDRDGNRAAGNLRSALWRLDGSKLHLLEADQQALALRGDVVVDVRLVIAWAERIVRGGASSADLTLPPWGIDALEILPGWYDDWALMQRERTRQKLLRAMEVMSAELSRAARGAEAVEAAMIAVAADPLREEAQQALIDAHLAEGNWVEACRVYAAYRDLLAAELALEPAPQLAAIIREHMASARERARASAPVPHVGMTA